MDSHGNGETPGGDRLSEQERRTLLTLEHSVGGPGLAGLWHRIRFRVMVVWGARLAVWAGLIICLAALATMWEELSTHVTVAVASEIVLTAGALLIAHGVRLWWYWGRANRESRR
jgi:hypothetical protein